MTYLISLSSPFVFFSGQPLFLLLASLVLGLLLFLLFQKPSVGKLVLFTLCLGLVLLIIKPHLGLDLGQLNVINAQRGEHPSFQTNLLSKIIHNKTELIHSFITNFDVLLSPVAIFASGFWHKISLYYPLGFLFPWDIYFIYRYFSSKKSMPKGKSWFFFAPVLLLLFLLVGLLYVDQALVLSLAIVYFLALLSAVGFSTLPKKTKIIIIVADIVYLLYQYYITSFFKI